MGLLTLVDRAPPEDDLDSSAFDGDVEVTRVEVVLREQGEGYAYEQDADSNAVIELFEVAKSHRRKGIGTKMLALLASRLPNKTMWALSLADEFSDAQGWTRHENQEDEWSSALYVQPARVRVASPT